MAFFNNTRDEDTNEDYPVIRLMEPADSLALGDITNWLVKNNYRTEAKEAKVFLKTWQPATYSLQADSFINCELNDTKWLEFRNHASARLKQIKLDKKTRFMFRYKGKVKGGIVNIHLDSSKGQVLATIKVVATKDGKWEIGYFDFPETSGTHDIYFSYTNRNLTDPDKSGMMYDWFYFTNPLPGQGKPGYDSTSELLTPRSFDWVAFLF